MTAADDLLDQDNWTRPLVLILSDGATLADVDVLARRNDSPTLYSITVNSRGNLRGILATTPQLFELRRLIDGALARIIAQEPTMRHLTVTFRADEHGQPASYRCVRCKTHWDAATTPPPCKEQQT